MKKTRNTAFIVELLMMFVILLIVIVMITKTFAAARIQSLNARHLTEAVCLAGDVAEVASASVGKDDAFEKLGNMAQTENIVENEEGFVLDMDFTADDGSLDKYQVVVDWDEEDSENGLFKTENIRVFYENDEEPIYIMTAGDYDQGAER